MSPVQVLVLDMLSTGTSTSTGSSTATKLPPIMSWDKAMFFFSHVETSYENIWFFEDDVFFFSETTLVKMDEKYPFCDLLTRSHTIKYENKVYTLPKQLDEKVARLHLEKIGVELDELTTEQASYIGVTVEGPYKSDEYRY